MSGVFNWLVEGYRLLMADGLTIPDKVQNAIEQYRQEADMFSSFCEEVLAVSEDNRLKTADLFRRYQPWAKDNGYKALNNHDFMAELRRRYEILRDREKGNVIVGFHINL